MSDIPKSPEIRDATKRSIAPQVDTKEKDIAWSPEWGDFTDEGWLRMLADEIARNYDIDKDMHWITGEAGQIIIDRMRAIANRVEFHITEASIAKDIRDQS